MSILTNEERMLLRSLDCRNQAEALTVLTHFAANLQTESILCGSTQALIAKLEQEHLDYAAETADMSEELSECQVAAEQPPNDKPNQIR